jgi:hypothetical protein
MPVNKTILCLGLCLALVACDGGGQDAQPALSSADQAKAAALFASYESARGNQNWEAAETLADQLREKFPDSDVADRLGTSLTEVRSQAARMRETRRLRDLWDYQATAVGKGVQRSAAIYSRTVPAEEGEVPPTPDAQLVLRAHPQWGDSAYLLFAQSRFDCGRPCAMKISFDDGPARSFAGKQADSGKGPALFIEDQKLFVDALDKAGRVRIQLPKGSGVVSSLMFEVGGYQAARFAKP